MPKWRTVTKSPFTTSEPAYNAIENQMRHTEYNCSATNCSTVFDFRVLCLPKNASCRIVEIGCTITGMLADYLNLAGKCVLTYAIARGSR